MESKNVEKVLKLKRKEIAIYSSVFIITVFVPILFSHTLWVKLLPFIAIFIYIIVIGRTVSLKYLIDDECNPQLFYYAFIGLNKKEPELDQNQRVAELIGDFETSVEIAYSRLNLCKNDNQRLSIILDIARMSFDAGDFDLTRKAYDDFNNLKINAKVKSRYDTLLKFYMYYIDGDFVNAKRHFDLNFSKYKSKKVSNILKYKMYYYDGLLAHALGENERAQTNLNEVISCCPNLYIAKLSNNLLLDSDTYKSVSLVNSADKGSSITPEKKKIDYWRIISLILALIAIVWSLSTVGESTDISADTLDKAVANYCEEADSLDTADILFSVNADEKHIACVFETPDCDLSVAYIKVNKDKTYDCKITAINNSIDSQGIDYIQTSGISKRLNYLFVSDMTYVPDGYECEKIKNNVYFCYAFDEVKFHFVDSTASRTIFESVDE